MWVCDRCGQIDFSLANTRRPGPLSRSLVSTREGKPTHAAEAGNRDAFHFDDMPTLDEVERRYLLHVLAEVGQNRTRAAEVLGVDRRTQYRMAERFGITLGTDVE